VLAPGRRHLTRVAPQRFLVALAIGHVARHGVDEPQVPDRGGRPLEPPVGAVGAPVAVLEVEHLHVREQPGSRPARGLEVIGVHELEPGLGQQFAPREAEHPLPDRVQAEEHAIEARNAEEVEREIEEAVQLFLDALAVDEKADLAADRLQRAQQRLVGLADRPAEELHHADHLAVGEDGEPQRGVEAGPIGQARPGEVGIVADVRDPRRLLGGPDASRKADAGCEHAGLTGRREVVQPGRGLVPGRHAAQHVRQRVNAPERPVFPRQGLAHRLEHARRRLGQCGRLGQRAGGLVDEADLLRPGAVGRAPLDLRAHRSHLLLAG